MKVADRVIGRFGGRHSGALVLVFGGLHGNEPAGIRALAEVFGWLEQTFHPQTGVPFYGQLLGVAGNLPALAAGQRFIDKDLNRIWTPVNIRRIHQLAHAERQDEDREAAELLALIQAELLAVRPETLVLLDLHTTSAGGGIFCIPTDDQASLTLAKALHVPVVLDLFDGLEGTLLRYGVENHLSQAGYPQQTLGVAFEAGQHDDPLAVSRAISVILHSLRALGCIRSKDSVTGPDRLLKAYSESLPQVTRVRHVHPIQPGDQFSMRPGYQNFQPVQQGEHLADDITGSIYAPLDGLILMPLYQPKGSDGFFIVEEV